MDESGELLFMEDSLIKSGLIPTSVDNLHKLVPGFSSTRANIMLLRETLILISWNHRFGLLNEPVTHNLANT